MSEHTAGGSRGFAMSMRAVSALGPAISPSAVLH